MPILFMSVASKQLIQLSSMYYLSCPLLLSFTHLARFLPPPLRFLLLLFLHPEYVNPYIQKTMISLLLRIPLVRAGIGDHMCEIQFFKNGTYICHQSDYFGIFA